MEEIVRGTVNPDDVALKASGGPAQTPWMIKYIHQAAESRGPKPQLKSKGSTERVNTMGSAVCHSVWSRER